MAKTRTLNKNKKNMFFVVGAFILSLISCIAVIFGVTNDMTTAKEVSPVAYQLGNINEDGKVIESKESIILSDTITVDGLTIEINEDATVSYKVAFYNEDGEFISVTEAIETDFDATSIPESATSVRVIITPYQVDGEAVKLNTLNAYKYVKQIKVTYAKE